MKLFLIMMYHHDISSSFFFVNFTQKHRIIGKGPQLTRKDYEKYQQRNDLGLRVFVFLYYN